MVEATHILDVLDTHPLMPLEAAMSATIEWLAGDECHALDGAGLAAGLGRRLRSAGLPLDHLSLYLRTLHPEIRSYTICWAPGEPAEVHPRQHDIVRTPAYLGNPVRRVIETGSPLVLRVDPPHVLVIPRSEGHLRSAVGRRGRGLVRGSRPDEAVRRGPDLHHPLLYRRWLRGSGWRAAGNGEPGGADLR